MLSEDQAVAMGLWIRVRHEGTEDGPRLMVAGSKRLRASVVVNASIVNVVAWETLGNASNA